MTCDPSGSAERRITVWPPGALEGRLDPPRKDTLIEIPDDDISHLHLPPIRGLLGGGYPVEGAKRHYI